MTDHRSLSRSVVARRRVVSRDISFRMVVGRVTSVVVVVCVGVVHRVERVHAVEVARRIATWRRRQDRIVAVVVVAVRVRTVVVARARSHVDHHPRLVAITVPAEAHRLEVLEGGEAVEFIAEFVVRHHRVSPGRIGTVSRNADGDSFDSTGGHSHVLFAVVVSIVGIQVDEDVTSVGVVSYILDIVIDGDRIGVVGQHGL